MFLRLLCLGFGFDLATARPYFYGDPYYPHNQRWGLWVGEGTSRTLVSILTVVPLQMWIGERLVPCVGIAGVVTHPQHRRQGYARRLLTAVLNALHVQGVPGAALQAFDFDFYRPLGWEVVGSLMRLRIAPLSLPLFPSEGVRRALETDYPAIRQLCEQQARPATGRLQRDELRWSYLLCLAIRAPQIEANTGVYTVQAGAKGWSIARGTQEGLPLVRLDMRTLALLTMGTFSAGELVARELLDAPPALIDTLDELFPARSPCLRVGCKKKSEQGVVFTIGFMPVRGPDFSAVNRLHFIDPVASLCSRTGGRGEPSPSCLQNAGGR